MVDPPGTTPVKLVTMPQIAPDAPTRPEWVTMPIRWMANGALTDPRPYSDDELAPYMPAGRRRVLRSFGHDELGVHWLLTRGGTPLHTDPAYSRYSHQLVLRNDGNRVRGLRDSEPWHPAMVPGTFYALDTHSPHQGTPDTRLLSPHMAGAGPPIIKFVIAVDRDELLTPSKAWLLLRRLIDSPLPEVGQTTHSAPHWKAS